MKTCPFCAEDIKDAAIKCRYCGSMLNMPGALALPGASATPTAGAESPASLPPLELEGTTSPPDDEVGRARPPGGPPSTQVAEAVSDGPATTRAPAHSLLQGDEHVSTMEPEYDPSDILGLRDDKHQTAPVPATVEKRQNASASKVGRAMAGLLAVFALLYPFIEAASGRVSPQELGIQAICFWFVVFPLALWAAKSKKPSPVLAWMRGHKWARLGCLILILGFAVIGFVGKLIDDRPVAPPPPVAQAPQRSLELFYSAFLGMRKRLDAAEAKVGETMETLQRCTTTVDCTAAMQDFRTACEGWKPALVSTLSELADMKPPDPVRPFYDAYCRTTRLKLQAADMYVKALSDPERLGLAEADAKWKEVAKANQDVIDEARKLTGGN